jgi:hypothetical protein
MTIVASSDGDDRGNDAEAMAGAGALLVFAACLVCALAAGVPHHRRG